MDEIDLQEQVGKGGYGAVYKGTWRGAVVAVKYAVCNVEDAQSLEQSIREVVLSKKMGHPNVVQTYAWTVLTGQEAAGVVRPSASKLQQFRELALELNQAISEHLSRQQWRMRSMPSKLFLPRRTPLAWTIPEK